eukprot:3138646-Rhodomonas_salina.2
MLDAARPMDDGIDLDRGSGSSSSPSKSGEGSPYPPGCVWRLEVRCDAASGCNARHSFSKYESITCYCHVRVSPVRQQCNPFGMPAVSALSRTITRATARALSASRSVPLRRLSIACARKHRTLASRERWSSTAFATLLALASSSSSCNDDDDHAI